MKWRDRFPCLPPASCLQFGPSAAHTTAGLRPLAGQEPSWINRIQPPPRTQREPRVGPRGSTLKKELSCCVMQRARLSSPALRPTTTPPCKRRAVPAWGIGRPPQDARCVGSCTELHRQISALSCSPISVSSDTPFEKGASRCSPGTS